MHRMYVPVLVSVSLLVACGGPPETAPTEPAPERPAQAAAALPIPRSTPTYGLARPFGLSQGVRDQGLGLGTWLVRSALSARNYTRHGQPPLTGTIELSPDGIAYSTAPNDALVVQTASGMWTFEIMEAVGDDASVEAFFTGDHRLHFLVRDEVGTDLEITSTRRGDALQAHIEGHLLRGREGYDLDLTWVGKETFDIDRSGTGHRSRLAVAGWVHGDALQLEVSERWRFELVSSPGGFVAQTAERSLDGGVVLHGHSYGFANIETRRAFRDGQPTELDTYWSARGEVLRDGQPWGQVRFSPRVVEGASGGFVQFVLRTPVGEELLEQHLVY